MTPRLRREFLTQIEAVERRLRQLREALPTHDGFQIDPDLLEIREEWYQPERLCYALFEGFAYRERPAVRSQIFITADPQRLLEQPWDLTPRPLESIKDSLLGEAFRLTAVRLGDTPSAKKRLAQTLALFGIDRCAKTNSAPRKLRYHQPRAADAIARCLAHLLDPQGAPGIVGRVYPLGANPSHDARPEPVYSVAA